MFHSSITIFQLYTTTVRLLFSVHGAPTLVPQSFMLQNANSSATTKTKFTSTIGARMQEHMPLKMNSEYINEYFDPKIEDYLRSFLNRESFGVLNNTMRHVRGDEWYPGKGEYGDYWQGDIVNPPRPHGMGRGTLNTLGGAYKHWEGGVIPYHFRKNDFSEARIKNIKDAMDTVSGVSCTKFVPRRHVREPSLLFAHFDESGCYAQYIGYTPQGNALNIASFCQQGTIVHEILHGIGFFHTHALPVRDRYIEVIINNVREDKRSNYDLLHEIDVNTFGAYFDMESIMIYDPYGPFSVQQTFFFFFHTSRPQFRYKYPLSPLHTLPENVGKRDSLSFMDIYQLQRLHNCCRIPWNYNNSATYDGRAPSSKRFSKLGRARRFAPNYSSSSKANGGIKSGKAHAQIPLLVAISICKQNLDYNRTKEIQLPLNKYYDNLPEQLNEYLRKRIVWNKTCTNYVNCARFQIKDVPMSVESKTRQSHEDPGEFGKHYEGDLMMDPKQTLLGPSEGRLWPNNTVLVTFDFGITERDRARILDALDEISLKTCIKFTFTHNIDKPYVYILTKDIGCYSQSVGIIPGIFSHIVNLNPQGCLRSRGRIIHQFLHILGVYHEHNTIRARFFLDLNLRNIASEYEKNFDVNPNENRVNVGFHTDFKSIMMYPSTVFAKVAWATVMKPISNDAYPKMGQREKMTQHDIAKLVLLYKCCGSIPGLW